MEKNKSEDSITWTRVNLHARLRVLLRENVLVCAKAAKKHSLMCCSNFPFLFFVLL